MATQRPNEGSIENILREELAAAKRLTEILNIENTAIRDRNAKGLLELTPEKLRSLQRLEALEKQRLNHSAGSQTDGVSSTETEAAVLWEQVIDVVRVCNKKNQLNGIMLRLRQESVQRALDLISDRDTGAITYAPDGSTKNGKGPASTWASA